MDDELRYFDATEQAHLISNQQVTSVELVEAAISRLEALNPTLNAVVHLDLDRARDRAARDEASSGPFGGVPFLMKDLVCHEAGMPFHEGNVHLRATDGTPMANAMLSLMHELGMDDVDSFGDSTGTLPLTASPRSEP